MKKQYTHYRISLLTGLLSLNILASCVHTKQELGWWPTSKRAKICTVVGSLMAATGLGTGLYLANRNPHSLINSNNGFQNGESTSFRTCSTPEYPMQALKKDFILNAIEEDPSTLMANGTRNERVKNPDYLSNKILGDMACNKFSPEVMQKWRDLGLDINAKDKDGATPLIYAIYGAANIEYLEFMIEKGADVNVQLKDGKTVLFILFMNMAYAESNGINTFTKDDYKRCIKMFKKHKVDMNAKNKDGKTVVDFIVEQHGYYLHSEYCDFIKMLIKYGEVDVNVQDQDSLLDNKDCYHSIKILKKSMKQKYK